MVCVGGLTEGRHSQVDGGAAAGGDVVHLGELVFGGGQVGFAAFGLAELAAVRASSMRTARFRMISARFLGGIGARSGPFFYVPTASREAAHKPSALTKDKPGG